MRMIIQKRGELLIKDKYVNEEKDEKEIEEMEVIEEREIRRLGIEKKEEIVQN